MKKLIVVVVSLILLISCKTQKQSRVELEKSEVMDSVIHTREPKLPEKVNKQLFKSIVKPDAYTVDEIANIKIYDTRFDELFRKSLSLFYQENNHEPKWMSSTGPTPLALRLYEQLKKAYLKGLDSSGFQLTRINHILQAAPDNPRQLEKNDILITSNAILFIIQLKLGTSISNVHKKRHEMKAMVEGLAKVTNADELIRYLDQLEPDFEDYKKLKIALQNYYEYQEKADVDPLFIAKGIYPGDYHRQVPKIRKRLLLTEPVEDFKVENKFIYDKELESAVKFFQMRHGLDPDGVIDDRTIEYLSMPLSRKIEMIKTNLNRMKDPVYPKHHRHIKVTIPEYMLRVYEDNEVKLSMKVIVGKEDWPTPLFEDTLEYVVFSPTWTVPKSIAVEEMLEKLRSDPYYYDNKDYKFYSGWHSDSTVTPSEVNWITYDQDNFPFKIVQQPGPTNALGRVKFMMPNKYAVYLHDTPADHLFDRKDRSLSHGCIRLERPVELAIYLLDEYKYDREKLFEKMNQEEPEIVHLPEGIPVDIVYRTAWVDKNGFVNFRKDIYDKETEPLYSFS